ncbi:MAG: acyl-homoserine-lactone synthase [Rhizobacter sp.]
MPSTTRVAIGRYRHQVFVQTLQWKLPSEGEVEQDEFDVASAVHVVASDAESEIVGYARLLPTTQNYLLGTHFPHLIDGGQPPSSPDIWELSRYAAFDMSCAVAGRCPSMQTRVGKRLLLGATRYVASQGGRQIVFCTTAAIERLALRWGVDIERLGSAQFDGNDWLVAARIHCNQRTNDALVDVRGPTPSPRPSPIRSSNPAMSALA